MLTLTKVLKRKEEKHVTHYFSLWYDYHLYVCNHEKKLSPFTSLVIIPLIFTLIAIATGVASPPPGADGVVPEVNIGNFVLDGISTTSKLVLCYYLPFFTSLLCWMLVCLTQSLKMIYFAKGDPMKVLMATAVVAAAVSLNGDGTTTTLICCSAFIPIYKNLI